MTSPRDHATPSHILYADDIMVFCRGTKSNLRNLMLLLKDYGQASGQLLSLEKCRFYAGSMSSRRVTELSSFRGFPSGSLPFTYLGVPFFKGKPKLVYLQPIFDKIKCKLSNWKGSHLSIMGRVQLVQSVIQGMLAYSFHIYVWPVALLKQLDG